MKNLNTNELNTVAGGYYCACFCSQESGVFSTETRGSTGPAKDILECAQACDLIGRKMIRCIEKHDLCQPSNNL